MVLVSHGSKSGRAVHFATGAEWLHTSTRVDVYWMSSTRFRAQAWPLRSWERSKRGCTVWLAMQRPHGSERPVPVLEAGDVACSLCCCESQMPLCQQQWQHPWQGTTASAIFAE